MADAIRLLRYLYIPTDPPPPPFFDCGLDPTPDGLYCADHPCMDGGSIGMKEMRSTH